jgi:hypothetical protein
MLDGNGCSITRLIAEWTDSGETQISNGAENQHPIAQTRYISDAHRATCQTPSCHDRVKLSIAIISCMHVRHDPAATSPELVLLNAGPCSTHAQHPRPRPPSDNHTLNVMRPLLPHRPAALTCTPKDLRERIRLAVKLQSRLLGTCRLRRPAYQRPRSMAN